MSSRVLIYGAGPVGVYLGSKLLDAGHQKVVLYGREKLKRLESSIRINDAFYKIPEKKMFCEYEDYDIILVTTKLYDTQEAIRDIQEYHPNFSHIAFLQDSLVDEGFYLGMEDHPGFATISTFQGYSIRNNQLLIDEKSSLGWKVSPGKSEGFFVNLLEDAGIPIMVSERVSFFRALKLIGNSAINAWAALSEKTIGELITHPEQKGCIDELMKESYDVVSQRVKLPAYETVVDILYRVLNNVSGRYSSIYQDLQANKPTEIEHLNGLIIKWGEEQDVPTPLHKQVYTKFKQNFFR